MTDDCGLPAQLLERYLWVIMIACGLLSLLVTAPLMTINALFSEHNLGLDRFNLTSLSSIPPRLAWVHLAASFTINGLVVTILYHEHWRCADLLARENVDSPHFLVIQGLSPNMSRSYIQAKYGSLLGVVAFGTSYSSIRQAKERRNKIRSRLEKLIVDLVSKSVKRVTDVGESEVDGWRKTKNARSTILGSEARSQHPHTVKPSVCERRSERFDECHWLLRELSDAQIQLSLSYARWCEDRSVAIIEFPNYDSASPAVLRAQSISPIWERMTVVHNRALRLENVCMSPIEGLLRDIGVLLTTTSLATCWMLPMAFVGALSQLSVLVSYNSWLSWLSYAPAWLLGTMQGILPQIMAMTLLRVFPPVLRWLVSIQRHLTVASEEVITQRYYFAFLYLHLFLVISICSSMVTVVRGIASSPASAATILAQNLPRSSNYFLSYLLTQGMITLALSLSQVMRLITGLAACMRCKTPRTLLAQRKSEIQWGTHFPIYSNLACIVLTLSVIAPLILPVGTVTFAAFWAANRYHFMFISASTGPMAGVFYLETLSQTFLGAYMQQLCLSGLFLLSGRSYLPHLAIMLCGMSLTAWFHCHITQRYLSTRRHALLYANHPASAAKESNFDDFVWLPKDGYGIAENEIEHLSKEASTLKFTTDSAIMTKKGTVLLQ